MLDVIVEVLEWMYKMVPVGIAILTVFAVVCAIHYAIVERRGMPWEKAERKEAERKAKAEEKARRDFWAGKRA